MGTNKSDRRIGPGRLTHGWHGPQRTTLRLARPGEAGEVARLAAVAGGPLDKYMATAIEDGAASKAVLSALRAGTDALIEPAARAAAAGSPAPLTELAIALVAEDGQQIVGTLCALPPGAYIAQLMTNGLEPAHAIVTALAVIKIKALAVDPSHQDRGIASALLAGCRRLYDQLGYHLLFGSFTVGSGLDAFYAARGFEIIPAGGGISMNVLLGQPARLGVDPGEQLFARWR
ncbi:MAG: GNAT family N-acetyltransferase [Streptosporangiaceae bacterium]